MSYNDVGIYNVPSEMYIMLHSIYFLLSYFLAGRVVSAFHGSCDPGGAPAQRSVSMLNVPPWTALYSGWASACLSLVSMWGTRHVVGASHIAICYNLWGFSAMQSCGDSKDEKWLSCELKSRGWKWWPLVLLYTLYRLALSNSSVETWPLFSLNRFGHT